MRLRLIAQSSAVLALALASPALAEELPPAAVGSWSAADLAEGAGPNDTVFPPAPGAAVPLPGAGTPIGAVPIPAPPLPAAPDMRPVWPGAAPIAAPQLDARARTAWLSECRHRMRHYYDEGRRRYRRHTGADRGGYDYCEAYFDEYYRYHAQAGMGAMHHGHGHGHAMAMRMVAVPRPAANQPCEETVVTEEYVPVPARTRYIPRRPAPRRPIVRDKRIRIN